MRKYWRRLLCLTVLGVLFCGVNVFAAGGAYTASLSPEKQIRAVGETAVVNLQLSSDTYTSFNALDVSLTYDTSVLSFQKDSSAGLKDCTVSDTGGTIRILGFGEDKKIGSVLTLAFTVKSQEETRVNLVSCKADSKENANSQDAPEAGYGNKTAVINGASKTQTTEILFEGAGASDVVGGTKQQAVLEQDFTFAVDRKDGYVYKVKVNGTDIEANEDGTYTIPAAQITGDGLSVTVEKTQTQKQTSDAEQTTSNGGPAGDNTASGSGTSTTKNGSSSSNSVKTGDENMPVLWFGLAALAAAAVVSMTMLKKKKMK